MEVKCFVGNTNYDYGQCSYRAIENAVKRKKRLVFTVIIFVPFPPISSPLSPVDVVFVSVG